MLPAAGSWSGAGGSVPGAAVGTRGGPQRLSQLQSLSSPTAKAGRCRDPPSSGVPWG